LSYASFVVPLVKAVQEQQETIDELKKEVKELRRLIEEIKSSKP
jgi:phage shock protein A